MKTFGDVVMLGVTRPDGSIRRVNAFVLASSVHAPAVAGGRAAPDAVPEEHLDVVFPVELAEGVLVKTRSADDLFRNAFSVRPAKEVESVGWSEVTHDEVAVSETNPELETAKAEVESLTTELAGAREVLTAYDAKIDGVQAELQAAKAELEAANAKVAELKAANAAVDAQAKPAKDAAECEQQQQS